MSQGSTVTLTDIANNAVSFVNLYGGDFNTFGHNAFVWAGEIDVMLEAPAALAAGMVSIGCIPVGQLTGGPMSIANYYKLGTKYPVVSGRKYSMKSSVRNHHLAYHNP